MKVEIKTVQEKAKVYSPSSIQALSLKDLVKHWALTKDQKLKEIERRESARVPENYVLESALLRAAAEVRNA